MVILFGKCKLVFNTLHTLVQTPPVSKATSKPSTVLCSECKKSCKRQQELQRHMLSAHFPRWLHCPHSPCTWRGHRKEDFKTHLELHPGTDPEVEPCLIYETRVVIDWIKNGTSVEMAARYALGFVSERARELGFEEEWKDLWG